MNDSLGNFVLPVPKCLGLSRVKCSGWRAFANGYYKRPIELQIIPTTRVLGIPSLGIGRGKESLSQQEKCIFISRRKQMELREQDVWNPGDLPGPFLALPQPTDALIGWP